MHSFKYDSKYGKFNLIISDVNLNVKEEKSSLDEIFLNLNQNHEIFLCFNKNLLQYDTNLCEFALKDAKISSEYIFENFSEIKSYILNWPLTTLRLITDFNNKEKLKGLLNKLISKWETYIDYINDIDSKNNNFLLVLRSKDEKIIVDLILKNDLINEKTSYYTLENTAIKEEKLEFYEYFGDVFFEKKLLEDIEEIEQLLMSVRNINEIVEMLEENTDLKKYITWICSYFNDEMIKEEYFLDDLMREKIGLTYEKILEDYAVFQNNEVGRKGLLKFLKNI